MLPALPHPELFFGLCSPIGTDNRKVINLLENHLRQYSYKSERIKITELMKSIKIEKLELQDNPVEKRYDSYIKYANKLREIFEQPYILSVLCSAAVRNLRRERTGKPENIPERQAYIFDQFKRKEEINLLRQVYGRLFVVISIYSEKEKRIERLTDRIAAGYGEPKTQERYEALARELVDRDEMEEEILHGQRLQEAFATGDLFINIDDPEEAEMLIMRFLKGFFGSNSTSPSREEYGMYLAQTAALRSLDLSRQVGAAIMNSIGDVITMGCNEVPKAHGGVYWSGDASDARDFRLGNDPNEKIKKTLLVDFFRRLKAGGYIKDNFKDENLKELISRLTSKNGVLRQAKSMDLLEFGRIIHAEMSALCDAARLGKSIKGSILYCTTFPCHICAKHIVAAGIKRVIFIEPYPKSYAEQLHRDAIIVGKNSSADKVIFEPFIGIAPSRYKDIFQRNRRKDEAGDFVEWADGDPQPIVKYTVNSYVENEKAVLKRFSETTAQKIVAGLIK